MTVIVLAPDADMARVWQYAVENLGDSWRCMPVTTADAALPLLPGAEVLLVLPGGEGETLLGAVKKRPPVAPPYILGGQDGPLPQPEELPALLAAWRKSGRLPALCGRHLPLAQDMASALLRNLDVPRRLRAWDFLPEMIALTVVHPLLLADLQHGLYPMIGKTHGMTAAGVERSLRLCVESTWMHGSLPALERFFGDGVDPEKGKPTNRAFLRRMQEKVTGAMQRLV
nr:sporulation initiation factor Spo0A C-terminal domain-containing protein [Clostridia bacterium]